MGDRALGEAFDSFRHDEPRARFLRRGAVVVDATERRQCLSAKCSPSVCGDDLQPFDRAEGADVGPLVRGPRTGSANTAALLL